MSNSTSRAATLVHLALLAVGAALAFASWKWAPYGVLVAASMTLSQTCLIAATAIWALREKAEDSLVDPTDNSRGYERATQVVRHLLHPMFMRRAAVTVIAVALVGVPAVTGFTSKTVWEWTVYAAALGAGECMYSLYLANVWNTKLRAHKASKALADLRQRERAAQVRALSVPMDATPGSDWGPPLQAIMSKSAVPRG